MGTGHSVLYNYKLVLFSSLVTKTLVTRALDYVCVYLAYIIYIIIYTGLSVGICDILEGYFLIS